MRYVVDWGRGHGCSTGRGGAKKVSTSIRRHHRRNGRFGAAILCFLASALATIGAVRWALDKTGVEEGQVGLALGLHSSLPLAIMARPQFFGRARVGFLGDSSVISYPKGRGLHDRLQQILEQRARGRFGVVMMGAPGMSSVEYYALAHAIALAHPEYLVVPFNTASLSAEWRSRWDRLEVLGWLPIGELPRALSLPLYSWGLTLDRLLS